MLTSLYAPSLLITKLRKGAMPPEEAPSTPHTNVRPTSGPTSRLTKRSRPVVWSELDPPLSPHYRAAPCASGRAARSPRDGQPEGLRDATSKRPVRGPDSGRSRPDRSGTVRRRGHGRMAGYHLHELEPGGGPAPHAKCVASDDPRGEARHFLHSRSICGGSRGSSSDVTCR